MVVLAIIAAITAVAIPAFVSRGSGFGSNPMSRTAREVQSLLRAARVYAITHNITTAVVYNLDNYQSVVDNPGNLPPLGDPLVDNVTDQTIRGINAAAVMYAYPHKTWQTLRGDAFAGDQVFVPVNDNEGNWQPFDDSIIIPLRDLDGYSVCPTYLSPSPRYDPTTNIAGSDSCSGASSIASHGMRPEGVLVFMNDQGPLAPGNAPSANRLAPLVERYVAHVFDPQGRLDLTGVQRQRFSFMVTPRPDVDVGERLVFPELAQVRDFGQDGLAGNGDDQINLMHIPIEVFRSSGRAKIATN